MYKLTQRGSLNHSLTLLNRIIVIVDREYTTLIVWQKTPLYQRLGFIHSV